MSNVRNTFVIARVRKCVILEFVMLEFHCLCHIDPILNIRNFHTRRKQDKLK